MPRPLSITRSVPEISRRLLFIQHTSLFEAFGGVEYYLDDMATMASRCFGPTQIEVIALGEGDASNAHYPITQLRRRRGIFRKLENRFSERLFFKASKMIRAARPDFLVSSHVSMGPVVGALSAMTGVPYLSFAYGIECWGNLWPQDEYFFRRSHSIISISHWTKRILVERGYPETLIQVVHPRLPAGLENKKTREPVRERPFTLLTVSRLDARERYKGQDHVISALAQLKKTDPALDLHYVIQGSGSDRERLKKIANENGLASTVEFRDPVRTRLDLEAAYRGCDAYIMPSRFGFWDGAWKGEGFGIVFLEAAAFGVPSIAYRCGGVMDILQHGENGLLANPDDISGLAAAIRRLATEPSLLEKLGLAAYHMVHDRFTEAPIEEEFRRAFQGIGSSSSK